MKKFSILLLSIILIMTISVSTLAVPEKVVHLTDNQLTELKSAMDKEGVDKQTQNLIITKIENGELPDSLNPEKYNLLPKDFYEFSSETNEKVFVFPDGTSIKISSEIVESIPVTLANERRILEATGSQDTVDKLFSLAKDTLGNRDYTDGGIISPQEVIYVKYKYSGNNPGLIYVSYEADVLLEYQNARIVSLYTPPSKTVIGGYLDNEQIGIVQEFQNGDSPAYARYTFNFNLWGGIFQCAYQLIGYAKDSNCWPYFSVI